MMKRSGVVRIASASLCTVLLFPLGVASALATSVEDAVPVVEEDLPAVPDQTVEPQLPDANTGTDEEQSLLDDVQSPDPSAETEAELVPVSPLSTQVEQVAPQQVAPPKESARSLNSSNIGGKCAVPQAKYSGAIGSGHQVLAGSNRFKTNAKIAQIVNSKATGGASAVFIANGNDFADGLSLGALAQFSGWPIFLVNRNSVPSEIMSEIAKVKPTHIYVAGGTTAVSNAVVKAIEAKSPNGIKPEVTRFAGKDRYDTSARIADCFPKNTPVMLTTGQSFADAVVAAGPAAKLNAAIVLTRNGWLVPRASEALYSLKPNRIDIIGQTWSESNKKNVAKAAGRSPGHITGKDRYETSAKVATAFFGSGNITYANGNSFPDALSGISVAEIAKAPIVLTQKNCRPKNIEAVTKTFKGTKVLLGGTNVVNKSSYTSTCVPPKPPVSVSTKLVNKARSLQGVGGYDCSSFVQAVYRSVGKSLPRTSWDQWSSGKDVSGSPRPGDVAIMRNGGHVAIYLGKVGNEVWIADGPGGGAPIKVRAAWGPINAYVRF